MQDTTENSPNARPAVTVVVPVYNEERYLAQCLDSLLAQTLREIEVICVDDGSTDGSADILAAYARKDPRVRVIAQDNAGPAKARNRAIEQARGTYLYCFDADDFCEPGLLSGTVEVAERYEADLVALPFKLFDNELACAIDVPWSLPRHLFPQGAFTWRDNPDATFATFRTVPWNKLLRTSFVRDSAIRFQEDVFISEDVMFSLPAVVLASRIACADTAMLYHRESLGTSAMDSKDAHPLDFVAAFRALRAFLEERGVMEGLRGSYVNWVAGGCVYNLLTLKERDNYDRVFAHLHGGGFTELGITERELGLIVAPEEARACRAILEADPEQLLFLEQLRLRTAFDQACYRERMQIEARQAAEAQRDEAQAALTRARAARADLERRLADLQDEHDRAMAAAEQKVGRAVCWLPRLVQRKLIAWRQRRR